MTYSDNEIAAHKAAILDGIATGKSLRSLCEGEALPSRETVRVWLAEDEAFSGQYARAREEQADFYADEIIEIADTEPDPAKARNRIDVRKWKAARMAPKRYGDRIDHTVDGSVTVNLVRFADDKPAE